MKQLSLWFAFFACAALASILPESCTKNGVLNLQSMSNTSSTAANKTSLPLANPVIVCVVSSGPLHTTRSIMVMNADGSNQTTIVNGTLSTIGGLSWAPSSTSIPAVNHIAYGRGDNTGIRIVDVTVVNGIPTASNDHQLSILGGLSNIGSPKWSPLGDQIAFVAGASVPNSIYLIPPGGGTPVIVFTATDGYVCTAYAWNSDGSKLLINEMTAAGPILNNVLELDLNNNNTKYPLIQGDAYGWGNMTCSPDGLHIAYNGYTSSNVPSIYCVTSDFTTKPVTIGSQLKVVDGSSPSWSPDNLMLLYEGGTKKGINYSPGGEYTYTFTTYPNGTIKNISTTGLWSDWRR